MVKFYRTDDKLIHELDTLQGGTWIQMVNPSVAEGQMVADDLNEQPVVLKKFLKVLGDNSFGIYLCHMLIIRILNKLVPMANVFPINAIFVIMISTVCVMMAHRILGKYAYVIGV